VNTSEAVSSQATRPTAKEPLALVGEALSARFAGGEVELPLLPRVATEVFTLARDEEQGANSIARLLQQDPALAGHVLRIANSPAYMPRSPIVSLQQAITRLGVRLLGEILLIASLQSGVFDVRGRRVELRAIWRHALASAAFGREIARALRCNVESAFLCGLLHTIGKPLVLQAAVDLEASLRAPLRDDELASLLEEFHVTAGGLLAEKWSLTAAVRSCIESYATYDSHEILAQEPVITGLADHLARHLLSETLDDDLVRSHRGWADLNLYPDDAEAVLAKHEAVSAALRTMVL